MRIAIAGLGLIGGSAGLALRAAGHTITGYARREATRRLALERGVVDAGSPRLRRPSPAHRSSCLPRRWWRYATCSLRWRPTCRPAPWSRTPPAPRSTSSAGRSTCCLSARSTRRPLDRQPPHGGQKTAGIEHADGALFRGRTWCIVPPPGADPGAVETITRVARDTGAGTLEIDATAQISPWPGQPSAVHGLRPSRGRSSRATVLGDSAGGRSRPARYHSPGER